MLGLARTAQIAGWQGSAPPPPANARRTGTASTNASLTWSSSGSTTQTGQYKFGTASMYPGSQSSYIYSANNPTFMNYGTGEFTIEWWMYISSLSSHSSSCDFLSNDNANGGFGFRIAQRYNTNGLSSANPKYINVFARNQADLDYWDITTNGGSNWTTGQWYFCALQRKGTTMSFWLDGSLKTRADGPDGSGGSRSFTSSDSSHNVKIGTADGSNGIGPNVYIDEVCFSNTYRYDDTTADIPVPSAPFTVDSYTTQLLHMDGSNGGTTFTNATS